jgi:LDH2 family malate/lactate/ureidoglycolate dehydrogenase
MSIFKMPEQYAVRVAPDALQHRVTGLFQWAGLPAAEAALAADALVSADLRGVESHGVSNMFRVYLDWLRNGTVNARPNWKLTRETLATANMDADRGLGLVLAPTAMEIAIAKARATGIGLVTVHNGRHLGMAQYHALLAVPHGMIGICLTGSGALMVPTFGREPRLGSNPIAIAAPCGQEPTFVFDAATTVVPLNKLYTAQRLGVPIPPGLVAADDGTPVLAPLQALTGPARLLPLGSTPETASHKGYGLACGVEILTSVLGGLTFAAQPGMTGHNHCLLAIQIGAFVDLDEFRATMDEYMRTLRATPPALGHERVLVPGLLEWEAEQERRANGIPLHPEVAAWLDEACAAAGV